MIAPVVAFLGEFFTDEAHAFIASLCPVARHVITIQMFNLRGIMLSSISIPVVFLAYRESHAMFSCVRPFWKIHIGDLSQFCCAPPTIFYLHVDTSSPTVPTSSTSLDTVVLDPVKLG